MPYDMFTEVITGAGTESPLPFLHWDSRHASNKRRRRFFILFGLSRQFCDDHLCAVVQLFEAALELKLVAFNVADYGITKRSF